MELITPISFKKMAIIEGAEVEVSVDEYVINIHDTKIQTQTINGWLYVDAKELSQALCENIQGETDYFFGFLLHEFKTNFCVKDKIKIIDIPKILKDIDKQKKINRGTIYLVTDGQYTKIGATTYNVEKRRNELQVGNPRQLNIIGKYATKNRFIQEQKLHLEYSAKHILGEWFELSDKDIAEILENGDGYYYEPVTFLLSEEQEKQIFQLQKIVKYNFSISMLNAYKEKVWNFIYDNYSGYTEICNLADEDNFSEALKKIAELEKDKIPQTINKEKLKEKLNEIVELMSIVHKTFEDMRCVQC